MDDDELINLASFRFVSQADAARWALEQAGIQAFLADANIVNADWFLGNAVGYVKLQVRRSQAEEAMAVLQRNPHLLNENRADYAADDKPMACLSCGAAFPDGAVQCPRCGWSFMDDDPDGA